MEILEKGKGWSIKARCTGEGNGDGGCKSLLLVSESDLFITESCCYDGSHDEYVTFQCPVCKKYTDLDEMKVPYQVRKSLKLKHI